MCKSSSGLGLLSLCLPLNQRVEREAAGGVLAAADVLKRSRAGTRQQMNLLIDWVAAEIRI